jgi:hypothetical protein
MQPQQGETQLDVSDAHTATAQQKGRASGRYHGIIHTAILQTCLIHAFR